MTDQPQFTIQLSIIHNRGSERYTHAIGCDQALYIGWRPVEEMKIGAVSMNDAVQLMRVREVRRDLLKQVAIQCAGQMADYMEDAEGWHDPSRIKPARKSLGGRWD